jgi:cell division protein ZapA
VREAARKKKMKEPGSTTSVTILGEEYRFRGASPELVARLAGIVDGRFRELLEARPALDVKRLAVMVCMNMAEELYKERDLRAELEGEVKVRVRRIRTSLEDVLGEHAAAAGD